MSNKRPDQLLIPILSYFLASPPDTRGEIVPPVGIDIIPNPTPAYPNFSAHLKMHPGTIYLLPTGMLFAFKKPVLFLRAKAIETVGIHSVTSRTFDFEVQMRALSSSSLTENNDDDDDDDDGEGVTAEDLEGVASVGNDGRRAVEFGMVDKKEFGRVETWIAKGIRDRSTSEDLKAKDKGSSFSSSSGANSKKREHPAEDDGGDETGTKRHAGLLQEQQSQQQHNGSTSLKQKTATATGADNEDDDDEDDEDFAPEIDEDGSLVEEYDSGAEGSDSDTKWNASESPGEDSEDDSDAGRSGSGEDTSSQKRKTALGRGSGGPKGAKGQQTKESGSTRSWKGKRAEEDSEDMDMDEDEDDEDEEDRDDEDEVDELMED